jgi:hypothetical protein
MPPEINDAQFLRDFYEMKTDVEVIKKSLVDCSKAKGKCDIHHDFITKHDAMQEQTKDGLSFWALLIACVSGLLTIIINFDKVVAAIK